MARKDVTNGIVSDDMDDTNDNFIELYATTAATDAEIEAARDGESTLLAKNQAQDAAIAAIVAGTLLLLGDTSPQLGGDLDLNGHDITGQINFTETSDTVYDITDGAAFEIDPANGNIQTVTLGDDRTPAATNFAAGQCILLGIDDGTDYAITWTSVSPTWVVAEGTASAPTLATTGYTWIMLWKVDSTIYGVEVGQP